LSKDFTEFLSYFQELTLPIVFQEGSEHEYSMKNDALPDKCIDQFILPSMDFEADDMTEFVPCGFWKTTHGQIVVIIWCARLLRYSFFAIVFDINGKAYESMEIAGFFTDGEYLIRRMVNIDLDDTFYIVEGAHLIDEKEFDISKTRKIVAEIMPDGRIAKMVS